VMNPYFTFPPDHCRSCAPQYVELDHMSTYWIPDQVQLTNRDARSAKKRFIATKRTHLQPEPLDCARADRVRLRHDCPGADRDVCRELQLRATFLHPLLRGVAPLRRGRGVFCRGKPTGLPSEGGFEDGPTLR
jgi:hypothetical protein